MWEQMELSLFVDEPESNIYFARLLQVDGSIGVGHFVSVLDKNEILNGQVMVAKNGQLFVIEYKVTDEQVSDANCVIEVTKSQQSLEQFLTKMLQSSCDNLEHFVDK